MKKLSMNALSSVIFKTVFVCCAFILLQSNISKAQVYARIEYPNTWAAVTGWNIVVNEGPTIKFYADASCTIPTTLPSGMTINYSVDFDGSPGFVTPDTWTGSVSGNPGDAHIDIPFDEGYLEYADYYDEADTMLYEWYTFSFSVTDDNNSGLDYTPITSLPLPYTF